MITFLSQKSRKSYPAVISTSHESPCIGIEILAIEIRLYYFFSEILDFSVVF